MNFVIQFTVRTTVELSSLQGVAKAYGDKDVAFLSLSVCKDIIAFWAVFCYTVLLSSHNQEGSMSYWTRTDDHLRHNHAPKCPDCGRPMVPIDDHGRFGCILCPKAPRGEHGFPVVDITDEDDL